MLMQKKPKVFESKVSIDFVKFNFQKKNNNRKDNAHIKALALAQGFIDQAI